MLSMISISDEMPGPWRRVLCLLLSLPHSNFNLRRDARPLAAQRQRSRPRIRLSISISDEMPGPWRHIVLCLFMGVTMYFNLRRDARPLATISYGQHVDGPY